MTVRETVQETLDRLLLPHGILSHHLKRVEADQIGDGSIPINNDEYCVFRIVSSRQGSFGDGRSQLVRSYIDINYYYTYEKTDVRFTDAEARIGSIIKEFLKDPRFRIANGQSDLYEADSVFRGINVEFLFLAAVSGDE